MFTDAHIFYCVKDYPEQREAPAAMYITIKKER